MEYNFPLFFGWALAEYQRTLVSDDTPFDRYMAGDDAALTPSQVAGLELFVDPVRNRCVNCHSGPELTTASVRLIGANPVARMLMGDGTVGTYDEGFYNIGVRPERRGPVARWSRRRRGLLDRPAHERVRPARVAEGQSVEQANDTCKVPRILAVPDEAATLLRQAAGFAGNPPEIVALLAQADLLLLAPEPIDLVAASAPLLQARELLLPFFAVPGVEAALNGAQLLPDPTVPIPARTRRRPSRCRRRPAHASRPTPRAFSSSCPTSGPSRTVRSRPRPCATSRSRRPTSTTGARRRSSRCIEFYDRGGDFGHLNPGDLDADIAPLGLTAAQKVNLVAFLNALTDERVRWDRAPFDHPSLNLPNGGTEGSSTSPTSPESPCSTIGSSCRRTAPAGRRSPSARRGRPSRTSSSRSKAARRRSQPARPWKLAFPALRPRARPSSSPPRGRARSTTSTSSGCSTARSGPSPRNTAPRPRGRCPAPLPLVITRWGSGFARARARQRWRPRRSSTSGSRAGAGQATGATLQASAASPQPAGAPVQFTATGEGSSGYQYRFWLFDGSTWQVARDFAPTATWTFPGSTAPGDYTVAVWVSTSPSTTPMEAQAFVDFRIVRATGPATGATLEASVEGPVPAGTPVSFTATGRGSSGYEYRFWFFDGATWSIARDFSPDPDWALAEAPPPGSYIVGGVGPNESVVHRNGGPGVRAARHSRGPARCRAPLGAALPWGMLDRMGPFFSARFPAGDEFAFRAGLGPRCALVREASMLPSVAIVTPSYNQAQFLAETLESVAQQGTEVAEYFVLDGGARTDRRRSFASMRQPSRTGSRRPMAVRPRRSSSTEASAWPQLRLSGGSIPTTCSLPGSNPARAGGVRLAPGAGRGHGLVPVHRPLVADPPGATASSSDAAARNVGGRARSSTGLLLPARPLRAGRWHESAPELRPGHGTSGSACSTGARSGTGPEAACGVPYPPGLQGTVVECSVRGRAPVAA